MLEDASQLLIHHVKRQTGIHKEDKQKIKTFLRQTLPDVFYHTRWGFIICICFGTMENIDKIYRISLSTRDVDSHCSYAYLDQPNFVNADPDPGEIQEVKKITKFFKTS